MLPWSDTFFQKTTVSKHCLFRLNRIYTITQAYWDISGKEVAFTTIENSQIVFKFN